VWGRWRLAAAWVRRLAAEEWKRAFEELSRALEVAVEGAPLGAAAALLARSGPAAVEAAVAAGMQRESAAGLAALLALDVDALGDGGDLRGRVEGELERCDGVWRRACELHLRKPLEEASCLRAKEACKLLELASELRPVPVPVPPWFGAAARCVAAAIEQLVPMTRLAAALRTELLIAIAETACQAAGPVERAMVLGSDLVRGLARPDCIDRLIRGGCKSTQAAFDLRALSDRRIQRMQARALSQELDAVGSGFAAAVWSVPEDGLAPALRCIELMAAEDATLTSGDVEPLHPLLEALARGAQPN